MKIRPVVSELFRADGRTDRHDEAICHFLQFFAKASEKNGPLAGNYYPVPLCLLWTVRDRIPVGTRFSARPDRPWGPPSLL